jgi:collagenase-like PrtC family protease
MSFPVNGPSLRPARTKPELVCPAGSLPALKAAIDHGADAVYMGWRDATNARNFPGLNFDEAQAAAGIAYAHSRGAKVLLALNTYAAPDNVALWRRAVDRAAQAGVDALILADAALLRYASRTYPELRLHLSVQASATSHLAINFYHEQFGIQRAVLPRVLSLKQVEDLIRHALPEIEVFGFGSLCVMVEGRCHLSSYVTGEAPNRHGACSPARAVRWIDTPNGVDSRLNGVLIDHFEPDEMAGYPTLCKGRFAVNDQTYYALEEPTSLNTIAILPELVRSGVAAIKIEGRQRSPAYVAQVTQIWREAIDACAADVGRYTPRPHWNAGLAKVAEGSQHTLGAYHRPWK